MSSRININATYAGDAHYRYHMSPLEIKASGRNAKQNISRTYLTNLADIAKELRRSPELILQCICVGTTSRCDRSSGIPSWYIKGGADQRQMQERIMQFCGHYVVCPKCGDCGTRLYAKAKSSKKAKGSEYRIRMSCGACGNDAATEAQDPQLGKCVAQHETPPKRSSGNPGKPNNPDKKPKAKPEDSDEEEWFTDLSEEAVQARRNALCPRAAQPFDSAIVTNSTQSTLSPAIEDQKESKVIKTSPEKTPRPLARTASVPTQRQRRAFCQVSSKPLVRKPKRRRLEFRSWSGPAHCRQMSQASSFLQCLRSFRNTSRSRLALCSKCCMTVICSVKRRC